MNKRTVLASLNKIANQLDNEGLHNEADTVTKVMSRLAYDDNPMQHGDESLEEDLYSPDGYDGEMDYDGPNYGDYSGSDDEDPEDPHAWQYEHPDDLNEDHMYGDDMNGYHDEDSGF